MPTKTASKISKPKAAKKPATKAPAKKVSAISSEERGEPTVKKVVAPKVEKKNENEGRQYFYANGKRKTSVATVRLYVNGKGTITINNRSFENYFPVFTDQDKILSALRIGNVIKTFDISAHVFGGGIHSQAEAVRHGVSKALLAYDVGLRTTLKHAGYLTRDSRIKERKKYGLRRARRAPQFSKR